VRAFAREGAAVLSVDVVDGGGEQIAAEATAAGPGTVRFRHCDVSSRAQVREVFAGGVGELGGLDAVVHVAGVERQASAEDITDADWDLIVGVNLTGTFVVNQEAFPYLRDNGGGSIVNFASGASLYPFVKGAHYSASKGGVVSWSRTIAHEWGQYGIRVVAVNPSIWTPMYQAHRDRLTPEQLVAHDEHKKVQIPLGGRLGDPDRDIAPVLVFLVSDAARFITGQMFPVDGGHVPTR
jgi:NAD(P)-dependent dehydrogenase (short-subunit alcohol dehydrogenase family)